jgi:hypothetical protein
LITDEGLRHLGGVRNLKLNYCSEITNAGLRYLSSVTTLGIAGCDLITEEGREEVEHRGGLVDDEE